jgi:3-oxoacyl-[acyl-carrier protein] reductase
MTFNLNKKVAVVTGASRGLGAAIASYLGACGAWVAVNYYHDHQSAGRVVDGILQKGGKAIPACYDITDEEAVKEMVARVRQELGPVDIVVNNATGPQPVIPVEQQTWQDHLDQLVFFVKAPLLVLQAVLPDMKQKHNGRIINIGSEVVELGNPEYGHYVAAKAAMLGLTRSWANELGAHGITVNLIAPGWIPVERHGEVVSDDSAGYLAGTPLGHQGVPLDIATATAFLASDEAAFITGQKLAVNGGKTLS